jgi:phage baseplate assembly protein V
LTDFIAIVRRLVAPLANKIRLTVSRGVVKLVKDSLKMQGVQVELLSDEVQDDVEHFQEYGLTSHPFAGAEVLFLAVGGNRGHGIAACVTDRRYRPKSLGEGDVCLYTDKGERVYLDRTGDIVNLGAKSAAEFVALAAKTKGELDKIKTDLDNVKSTFDAHTHILTISAMAGAGGTGTAAVPAAGITAPHTPAAVAASKVKAT